MSVTCENYNDEVREHRKGQCDACGGDPTMQLQGMPLCLSCAVKCIKCTAAVIAMDGNHTKEAKAAYRDLEVFFGAKKRKATR